MNTVLSEHDTEQTTLRTYVTGFGLSIALTLGAYLMVVNQLFTKWTLAIAISFLALVQFAVQLIFFLHLGQDTKPRFKLGVFLFMLLIVLIIAGGSLWIMHSLNYRMDLSPERVQKYMNSQVGL